MQGDLNTASLRNRYFAMRHGESEANVEGIILSDPESGVDGYGLSANGRRQVLTGIRRENRLDAATLIYSSDFKRALETARLVHEHLRCRHPIQVTASLRERFFGDLEHSSSDNYAGVWAKDAVDASHRESGVESATSVRQRAWSLVLDIEATHQQASVLMVAHGDVLQLLQTAFRLVKPEQHRTLAHLNTAEIRELVPAMRPRLPC